MQTKTPTRQSELGPEENQERFNKFVGFYQFLSKLMSYLLSCWKEAEDSDDIGGFYIIVYIRKGYKTWWTSGRTPKRLEE